ncbi:phosphotransferase [Streptomyces sp. NPDC048420]|uniref:phosphotransferase family protein n=1 Tax=Streptomyces sp. NPDC048420 TaxID=3155755 RepID=UPI0034377423
MTLTAELRGRLPMRPFGPLTRPVDFLTVRRLAGDLCGKSALYGGLSGTRRTLSDLLVFRLDGDSLPPVVVKHPRSPRAIASLAQECEAVRRLERDERLGAWRHLLPVVEECRLHAPLPCVVERCLPGLEGDMLLRVRPQLANRMAVSALGVIRELHRATGTTVDVTAYLGGWIDPRLAALAEEVRWCRHGRGAEALCVLRDRLVRALTGRRLTIAWTHGDFHPGNVLLGRRHGAPLGVIDWAGAVPEGPSVVDCYTFVLTMRHQRDALKLGRIVADVVRRASLLPEDRWLLGEVGAQAADGEGPPVDGERETALTLLTWLWHVAGNVTKSSRYGRSHRWIADNVIPVLDGVAAGGSP